MSIKNAGPHNKGIRSTNWGFLGFNTSPECIIHDHDRKNVELIEDALMPSQFADMNRSYRELTGEEQLLLAVLNDAIRCLRYKSRRGVKGEKAKEAEEWFQSMDESYIYAFRSICHRLFDVDPNKLRDQILTLTSYSLRIHAVPPKQKMGLLRKQTVKRPRRIPPAFVIEPVPTITVEEAPAFV